MLKIKKKLNNLVCNSVKIRMGKGFGNLENESNASIAIRFYLFRKGYVFLTNELFDDEGDLVPEAEKEFRNLISKLCECVDAAFTKLKVSKPIVPVRIIVQADNNSPFFTILFVCSYNPKVLPIAELRFWLFYYLFEKEINVFLITNSNTHESVGVWDNDLITEVPCLDIREKEIYKIKFYKTTYGDLVQSEEKPVKIGGRVKKAKNEVEIPEKPDEGAGKN